MGRHFSPRQLRYLWAIGIFKSKPQKVMSAPNLSPKLKKGLGAQKSLGAPNLSNDSLPALKSNQSGAASIAEALTKKVQSTIEGFTKESKSQQVQALHNLLYEASGKPFGSKGEFEITHSVKEGIGASRDMIQKTRASSQWLSDIRGKDTKGLSVELFEVLPKGERPYAYSSTNQLVMSKDSPTDIYVHEMAHIMEVQIPGVRQLTKAYLMRTFNTTSKPVKMSELMDNPLYGDEEVAFRPKPGKEFYHDYMGRAYGKEYGVGVTEVLSLGLERLYSDPVGLYKEAPDLFQTVVQALHT